MKLGGSIGGGDKGGAQQRNDGDLIRVYYMHTWNSQTKNKNNICKNKNNRRTWVNLWKENKLYFETKEGKRKMRRK